MGRRYDLKQKRARSLILFKLKNAAGMTPAKKLVFSIIRAQSAPAAHSGRWVPGRFAMRKFAYAFVAVALLVEPTLAMPVVPMPAAPVISEGQIVDAAYGHWRRVTRRTVRRHYRRW
jgi:hypothetical protein